MNGPIRRIALALFLCFMVLLGFTSWFQVIGVDRYRDNPRNPRSLLAESGKERGVIVTIDGTILARSTVDPESSRAFIREYPEGEAFSSVTGYFTGAVGSVGLEAAYATDLRSRRDVTISDLIAATLGEDLRPRSLQVTIDPDLTRLVYQLLDGRRGSVVAMDPSTGEILAYVSSPSFDPNTLVSNSVSEVVDTRQSLLDDPDQPLLDRAGRTLYAPGSTFKTVVAATAIETGFAAPETSFPDPQVFPLPGSTAGIANADGRFCGDGTSVTLQRAFVRSCNTVFARLAIDLGAEDIGLFARGFGFGRVIEFPWPISLSVFPVRELTDDPAALGQSGIGERDVRATTLTMASVAATIANEGEVMVPMLVRQIFDADGNTVRSFEPRVDVRAVSPATAAIMTRLMERVVTEGTGSLATVPNVRVAGKTGTAEGPDEFPIVWFIGFAPVENPSIALAVVLENGGGAGETAGGGRVAAPIAARLIDFWLGRR